MRKEEFISVLSGCAIRRGYDPSELQPNQVAQIVEYINDRVKEGWNKYAWPDAIKVEERLFRPELIPTVAYEIGDEVFFRGKYLVCIGSRGAGNSVWDLQPVLDRYVAYQQEGHTEIVDVLGVYCSNPRTTRVPERLKYSLSDNGVQVSLDSPDKVWIEFTTQAPQFTSNYWSSTTDYTVGNVVFDEAWKNLNGTGECYKCISPNKNQQPNERSPFWKLIPFPKVLATFVRRAVDADMLREDEQFAKADAAERIANEKLEQEILNLTYKQNQYCRFVP